MEILWPTLGICVLVCFVFFVLVQHWQRVLRHQTWTIRRLNERVRNLEEVDDPEFRRRLGESVPSPLEQVFTFSFRLSDQFWRETLHATQETSSFIQAFGSFLGSVKIERWRGHSVATITEVLPDRRSAKRKIDHRMTSGKRKVRAGEAAKKYFFIYMKSKNIVYSASQRCGGFKHRSGGR